MADSRVLVPRNCCLHQGVGTTKVNEMYEYESTETCSFFATLAAARVRGCYYGENVAHGQGFTGFFSGERYIVHGSE